MGGWEGGIEDKVPVGRENGMVHVCAYVAWLP